MDALPLEGRTCLVTGASSGIGEATAVGLARLGARVLLAGRSRERGERALAAVTEASGSSELELVLGDLASLQQVRELAKQVLDRAPRLHVLVNNAGLVRLRRSTTVDGHETTFAVNHLAPFLLTNLLLPRLEASAPARVVNVSSHAHRMGRLDLDDLQSERRYGWMRVYGASKLANLLFTRELDRRFAGRGIDANALHPGGVATRLGQDNGRVGRLMTALVRPFFLSPEQGAETSIHLASAPELAGVSGRYFHRKREVAPSAQARDPEAARRLWDESARLTGLLS